MNASKEITLKLCKKWRKDSSINPLTQRKIKKDGPLYKKINNQCEELFKQERLKEDLKALKKKDLISAIKKYFDMIQNRKKRKAVFDVSQGAMLAHEYLDRKTAVPIINPVDWYVSEKFDGMRAIWDW